MRSLSGRSWPASGLIVLLLASLLALASSPAPAGATAVGSPNLYVLVDSVLLDARDDLAAEFTDYSVQVAGFPGIRTAAGADVVAREPWLVGETAIVSLGHNFDGWDAALFDRSIDAVVNNLVAAGAKRVIWVSMRHATPDNTDPTWWFLMMHYAVFYPQVNERLYAALERHPELTIADWTSLAHGSKMTRDAMHLTDDGKAAMMQLLRESVEDAEHAVPAGHTLRIPITSRDGVPDTARAAAVRVTVENQRGRGGVIAWGCDLPRPSVPTLRTQHSLGPQSNLAIVELGASGDLCVFTTTALNIAVDLQGWTTAASSIASTPQRLADHIPIRASAPTPIVLPTTASGAEAIVLNVTTHAPGVTGAVSVHSCSDAPRRSSRSQFLPGREITESRVVMIGPADDVCVSSTAAVTVSVDLTGSVPRRSGRSAIGAVNDQVLLSARGANSLVPGTPQRINLAGVDGLPGNATNLVLSVQTVGPPVAAAPPTTGSLSIRPCSQGHVPSREATFASGRTANTTLLTTSVASELCVWASAPIEAVVRVTGWIDSRRSSLDIVAPVELWRTDTDAQRANDLDFTFRRTEAPDADFGTGRAPLPG